MNPAEANDRGNQISLAEASRIAGVSTSTLKRWADEGLIPIQDGRIFHRVQIFGCYGLK